MFDILLSPEIVEYAQYVYTGSRLLHQWTHRANLTDIFVLFVRNRTVCYTRASYASSMLCQYHNTYESLPSTTVDKIGFCHSISLIYVAHVAVIIRHNLRIYGLPIIVAEITLCWWTICLSKHVRPVCLSTVLQSSHP